MREIKKNYFEKIISDVFNHKENWEKDKVGNIIGKIVESYNVEIKDILGDKRNQELILPRHMIMYLLKKEAGLSFPKIGKIMKRDHTSVIHAYKKINRLLQEKNDN